MPMPTLYETVRTWLDAQRALNGQEPETSAADQAIIDRLVTRLGRHRSLADLAAGYYRDGNWWLSVTQEFSPDGSVLNGELLRDAAYYQRLLELRRPGRR